MKRCHPALLPTLRALAFATASLVLLAPPAFAQADETQLAPRQFPANASRATLMVLAAPDITLNDRPDRLSPAVRIRDANNSLVLPASLAGQKLTVNYVRENLGLVHQVWILSRDEARQKMPRAGSSDAPPDNRNTPYDQLPAYGR